MKSHVIAAAIGMFALPSFATSVSLSGIVLALDSTAKSGVVVSLSGTALTATTGSEGAWSFSDVTASLASVPTSSSRALSKRVVLDGSRLRLAFSGRDENGRPVPGSSSVPKAITAARSTSSSTLDTLVYSWNGTVILRDTISMDSLTQTGILRFFDTTVNSAITYGYVSDAQGHLYRTTTIGTQTWMAQNLNYAMDSSWCYGGDKDSCNKYGRLYQWAAVMDTSATYNSTLLNAKIPHQGICPTGWHVPSDAEWSTLVQYVDSAVSGTILKSTSGWYSRLGADTYGFRVLPAGFRSNDGTSINAGKDTYFWLPSEDDADALSRHFYYSLASVTRDLYGKTDGFSLRCLEN